MNFKNTTFVFIVIMVLLFTCCFYYTFSLYWLLLPIWIYLSIVVWGCIHIQTNFFIRSINAVKEIGLTGIDPNSVLLSFDDGIHPVYTPQVLDILNAHQIKAVFFLIGKEIKGHEAIVRRMKDEGHCIGNHSYAHSFWFDMKSTNNMLNEINKTNELIHSITGKTPVFFRPPYGVTNPNLARAVQKSNMQSMGWTLRSMDTVAKSSNQLLQKLKNETKQGDIILLHDRCPLTVAVLTDYILFCKQQDFTFTTLPVS